MVSKSVIDSPPIPFDTPQYREALRQVLVSRTFSKAPRLCSMLEYIVDNTLSGRLDSLTEQQIGIAVFHRVPGYNSGEDTIVRGTARHLRQRLEQYYVDEGSTNAIRIAIPKGGYVAQFSAAEGRNEIDSATISEPALKVGDPISTQVANHDLDSTNRWPPSARVAVAFLVALALLLPLVVYLRMRSRPVAIVTNQPQPLWRALFTPDRKTIIVPGDASLDAYIAWEHQSVSLENYANQAYQQKVTVSRPPSGLDVPLSVRSVTPMADLRLVADLVRAPESMGMPDLERNMEIRYARDVAVADTHDNNLILIGSETFNPWVSLYQPAMDFVAHWNYGTDLYTIENKAPRGDEQPTYTYDRRAPNRPRNALTHIALLENSQGQGRVLIVEGTSMGTTYGAVNFLTHRQLWEPVLRAATDSANRLHNFEVLLAGDFVHGGVSNTRIVALHVH